MENIRAILGSLEILEETESIETKAAAAENIRRHARILITKLQKTEGDIQFLLREVERLENALILIPPPSTTRSFKKPSYISY